MINASEFIQPTLVVEWFGHYRRFQKLDLLFVDEDGQDTKTERAMVISDAEGNYEKVPVREINPVQLRAEILEKCGFKQKKEQPHEPVATLYSLEIPINDGGNSYEFHATCMHHKSDYTAVVNYLVNDHWASRNLLYLHQIQSLYYTLTGEELPANL